MEAKEKKGGTDAISYLEGLKEGKKQGVKEVVEWIKARREGGYNLCLKVHWEEWQAQLKEWGIE